MKKLDVLIVGGGPAGSTLAWSLRDSGYRVGVMDRAVFPRDKVCAGWVTPAVMEELDIDLEDYARGRTLQPIHGFRISRQGQKQVTTCYPGEPVSYGIRRSEFDHYLLERCGAELILGQAFNGMEKSRQGWCVNERIEAHLVVGAGGHFCPVARAIGAKVSTSERVVAAQEVEFEMSDAQRRQCSIDAQIPELYFTHDLVGYGWVFRKGNYLNIGLGREDSHHLSDHVQAFVRSLKQQGKIPADIPEKFHGHAYLLYPHALREVFSDNVLLIGDAVGLAYPQSGEGIRPAVESALLAARVIGQSQGDFSQTRLEEYFRLLTERFGRRQPGPSLLEQLPGGLKQFLAGQLMKSEWFARNVVMDRWFLQRGQSVLEANSLNPQPGV